MPSAWPEQRDSSAIPFALLRHSGVCLLHWVETQILRNVQAYPAAPPAFLFSQSPSQSASIITISPAEETDTSWPVAC